MLNVDFSTAQGSVPLTLKVIKFQRCQELGPHSGFSAFIRSDRRTLFSVRTQQ